MSLTLSRQTALEKMQNYRKSSINNPANDLFKKQFIQNRGMYDGDIDAHWDKVSLDELGKRGQAALVVNLIATPIDALSGVEIQNRHRATYRSDSGVKEDEMTAYALSQLYYNDMERERVNYKRSDLFRDGAVGGAGFSNQYFEKGIYKYEYVDPLSIHLDWSDVSPQFTKSKFIGRDHYLHVDQILKNWPKAHHYIDLSETDYSIDDWGAELQNRQTGVDNYDQTWSSDKRLVCEIQYKVAKKAYRSFDKNNRYFETFYEEKAEKIARSSKEIEEFVGERTMRGLYIDDYLLEYAPLDPDIPDLSDFSYIPFIWKKNNKTNVPYGITEQVKPIQIDFNVRYTKALYLINSSSVTIQGNLPPGMTVENIRSEMQKTARVIQVPSGSSIDIQSNSPYGKEHLEFMREGMVLMQRIHGVHDEMLGIETNATSAIAQNVRQVNSMRNNVYGFDNFTCLKEREARLYLQLFQATEPENISVRTLNEEEQEELWLNLNRICEVKGKPVVINDISNIPVSIYIEEVPDYQSIAQEEAAGIPEMLNNPRSDFIFSSPETIKLFNPKIRDKTAQRLYEQYKASIPQQMAAAPPSPAPAGNVPPPINPQQMLQPII